MSQLNALLKEVQTGYTTIRVFLDSRGEKYTYKCGDLSVKRGDAVVVVLPDGILHVGRVAGVDEEPQIDENVEWKYRWIVCKVNKEDYEIRLAQEAAIEDYTTNNAHIDKKKARELADRIYANAKLGG